jgi:hypothetical protein
VLAAAPAGEDSVVGVVTLDGVSASEVAGMYKIMNSKIDSQGTVRFTIGYMPTIADTPFIYLRIGAGGER